LDANLIRVPGYMWACLSVSWHFWLKGILLEEIKECMKKDARDGSFLADLCPMGGVVSYRRLVGIEVQRPHTLFEVVGMMARLPCYPATLGRLALLTCGPSPHSQ
jgi:hypothetical protein